MALHRPSGSVAAKMSACTTNTSKRPVTTIDPARGEREPVLRDPTAVARTRRVPLGDDRSHTPPHGDAVLRSGGAPAAGIGAPAPHESWRTPSRTRQ
jgi:hypothetical protein